jgi:HD-GYP domain-containing protein (c-di-GMP phosphodiesterase class II)
MAGTWTALVAHPRAAQPTELIDLLSRPPLGLGVTTASSYDAAIAQLGLEPFAAVISFHRPGELDGVSLLNRTALMIEDALRILVVEPRDEVALSAPAAGTTPIIRLPVAAGTAAHLVAILTEGLKLRRLVSEQRDLVRKLGVEYDKLQRREKLLDVVVKERTRELRISYEKLKRAHRQTLFGLAEAIEAKDPYTNGHCGRVAGYALMLGEASEMPADELETLEIGAFLHDIGKIGVRDNVLLKPGPLDEDEWEHMRQHPQKGYEIASQIESLEPILPAVRSHHERWDGTGYPDRIAGADIPLAARIVAIADAYDAMATDRPYKSALPFEVCEKLLRKNAGVMYDAELVEIFCRHQLSEMFASEGSSTRVLDPTEAAQIEAVDRS